MPRTLYFDASALVKRYVEERGSEVVVDIIASGEFSGRLFTSRLTHVEVLSALNKKVRQGRIDEEHRRKARLGLDGDLRNLFALVDVSDEIIDRAVRLLYMEPRHSIGAVDTLHLESVREVWSATSEYMDPPVLVTSDRKLTYSARAFVTFDPERDNPDLL